MSDFESVHLSDVIAIKHGYAFPGRSFSDDPIYPTLLTPGNFSVGGGFRTARPKTFTGSFPEEYRLGTGDLVVTMTDLSNEGATLGLPALVPKDGTYLHNQRIGLVEIMDSRRVSAGFLHYYLRNADYRAHILGTASGSTVRHTSPSRIGSFPANLPTLCLQEAIADVLGALDDKIAANASLIATADELAVVSYQALTAVQAEAQPLSSLAEFVNGKAFTNEASGTGRVVIRIAELNSGLGGSTVYNDIEVADQHLARPGELLFAWSGSLTVHRWYRPEGIVNQHIFKVIATRVPLWVVNGALRRKLAEFKGIAADKATTMGHIQRRHLDEEVLVPTADLIAQHDALMTSLWDRALQAEQESLALAELRDALLPELMSGRLRVKDAEQAVGEVV